MVAVLVDRNQEFVPCKQVAHTACPILDVVEHIALLHQLCEEEGVLHQDDVRQRRHHILHLGHEMQVDLHCLQPTPTLSLCLPQRRFGTHISLCLWHPISLWLCLYHYHSASLSHDEWVRVHLVVKPLAGLQTFKLLPGHLNVCSPLYEMNQLIFWLRGWQHTSQSISQSGSQVTQDSKVIQSVSQSVSQSVV